MPVDTAFMDKLTALCKRRGFIYQSSEIYGGIGGFWDYGPLGVELKRNIKDLWWHDMVTNPPTGPDGREVEMVGIDCSIIMNPKVWEASGHVAGFRDPMISCKAEGCRALFRADKVYIVQVLGATMQLAFEKLTEAVKADARAKGEIQLVGPISAAIEADGPEEAMSKVQEGLRAVARHENWEAWKRVELRGPATRTGPHGLSFRVAARDGEHTGLLLPLLEVGGKDTWRCPKCSTYMAVTEPRQFNLMFESHAGAVQDEASKVYLRPETAQGIFANFKNVLDTTRVKVPFGIAQIGKAFRNEINPRNYTFRSREFEQMEIEFFCRGSAGVSPAEGSERARQTGSKREITDMEWYEFWRKVRHDWYVNLGLRSEKLRLRDQGPEELAHYSKACADIEYLFPFSDEFQELEGVAHRGNFDLTQHQKFSGKDLTYFDDEAWQRDRGVRASSPQGAWTAEEEKELKNKPPYRFLPTVIEPSAGVDRTTLALLCEAYTEDQAPDEKGVMQPRVVMRFHRKVAPIKVAVFPLVNRETMPDIAYAIYKDAKKHLTAFYDEKGAIGRRYRRQDEAGTPFCVTVDGQTLQDGTVTIRDRDTLRQVRVHKDNVVAWLKDRLAAGSAGVPPAPAGPEARAPRE
jgi:glycyl-tRNA synthetase